MAEPIESPINREAYGAPRIVDSSNTVYAAEAQISVNRPSEDITRQSIPNVTTPIYLGNKGTPRGKGKK